MAGVTCHSQTPRNGIPTEKLLDDAQKDGTLQLIGRNLKELPKYVMRYDLRDTVHADLSWNQLNELPRTICECVSIEDINCSHNVIKHIPSSVIKLQFLRTLDLSRNHLSYLPVAVCQLRSLTSLFLSSNRLVSLPEELVLLESLQELDVSCNRLTCLPRELGDISSLRVLLLRQNLLLELPVELCRLRLKILDVSGNKLTSLPHQYQSLDCLEELRLDQNPLVSPPANLCSRGLEHVMKFLLVAAKASGRRNVASSLPGTGNGLHWQNTDSVNSLNFISSLPRAHSTLAAVAENLRKDDRLSDERRTVYSGDSGYNTTESSDKPNWIQRETCLNDEDDASVRAPPSSSSNSSLSSVPAPTTEELSSHADQKRTRPGLTHSESAGRLSTMSTGRVQYSSTKSVFQRLEDQLARGRRFAHNTSPSSSTAGSITGEPPLRNGPERRQSASAVVARKPPTEPPSSVSTSSSMRENMPRSLPTTAQSNGRSNSVNSVMSAGDTSTVCSTPRTVPDSDLLIEDMKKVIECRLKIRLPDDINSALRDGVILCHLANQLRPRSVTSVHVPSPGQPMLGLAKCRRNLENFLEACRREGVQESDLFSIHEVVDCSPSCLTRLSRAVLALVSTVIEGQGRSTRSQSRSKSVVTLPPHPPMPQCNSLPTSSATDIYSTYQRSPHVVNGGQTNNNGPISSAKGRAPLVTSHSLDGIVEKQSEV